MKHKVTPFSPKPPSPPVELLTISGSVMSNTLLTLFNPVAYEEYYRTGFWRDDTVYSLAAAHAIRAPDRVAIRSRGRDVTYRELVSLVNAFAADLAAKGVIAGQRVAVW